MRVEVNDLLTDITRWLQSCHARRSYHSKTISPLWSTTIASVYEACRASVMRYEPLSASNLKSRKAPARSGSRHTGPVPLLTRAVRASSRTCQKPHRL
jgi:hypothetical protein